MISSHSKRLNIEHAHSELVIVDKFDQYPRRVKSTVSVVDRIFDTSGLRFQHVCQI